MKRMTKTTYLLSLLLMLALVLTGCGGAAKKDPTPTEGLTEVLEAFKAQDYQKVATLTGSEETGNIDDLRALFASSFSEGAKDQANAIVDSMLKKISGFTYNIKDEKIDGDKATVQVEITNIDLGKAMEEGTTKGMEEAMASMTAATTQEEAEAILLKIFQDAIENASETKTETIDVHMVKNAETSKWSIDNEGNKNDALINAVMGYMNTVTG